MSTLGVPAEYWNEYSTQLRRVCFDYFGTRSGLSHLRKGSRAETPCLQHTTELLFYRRTPLRRAQHPEKVDCEQRLLS